MAPDDDLIAHFDEAPVVEVVVGITLDPCGPAAGPLMSAFWKEHLREAFPIVEVQPPYSPPVEEFGRSQPPLMQVQLGVGFSDSRLFALSKDRQELIQLQPGWFACNWRKANPGDDYDHWPRRRGVFDGWHSLLAKYMARESGVTPAVRQCEVTYVNHITPNNEWSDHSDFGRIFTATLGAGASERLESLSVQAQSTLVSEQGAPIGRLYVKIIPGFARDGTTPIYVLELTARGMLTGLSEGTGFLDAGREAIVATFISLTTPAMHAEWKRREG
ncbi:MAG: TIGR04255 family protein [Dermatophilaceae bacterium]